MYECMFQNGNAGAGEETCLMLRNHIHPGDGAEPYEVIIIYPTQEQAHMHMRARTHTHTYTNNIHSGDGAELYEVIIYPTQEQVHRARAEYPSLNAYSALGVHDDILTFCHEKETQAPKSGGKVRTWDVAVVGDLEPASRMENIVQLDGRKVVLGRHVNELVRATYTYTYTYTHTYIDRKANVVQLDDMKIE